MRWSELEESFMARSLDSYFAFNNAAMTVKNQRLEVISGNIANASTPGYKARDLDFKSMLRKSFADGGEAHPITAENTNKAHLGGSIRPAWADLEAGVVYPVPFNPSLDNNTVEIGVEQARYGRAIVDYQASVQFMENKISGLRKAFKGE